MPVTASNHFPFLSVFPSFCSGLVRVSDIVSQSLRVLPGIKVNPSYVKDLPFTKPEKTFVLSVSTLKNPLPSSCQFQVISPVLLVISLLAKASLIDWGTSSSVRIKVCPLSGKRDRFSAICSPATIARGMAPRSGEGATRTVQDDWDSATVLTSFSRDDVRTNRVSSVPGFTSPRTNMA